MPTLKERIASFFFGSIIEQAVDAAKKAVTATITARVDDSPGWDRLSGGGPADRPWFEKYEDLTDNLEAWRKSFLIRRIVTLIHSYVIGSGITVTSKVPKVETFIRDFWNHPKNKMDKRLIPMCDELTRTGELFPVIFTNRLNGMSYIRVIPTSVIPSVETDPDDYETELRYEQTTFGEPKFWNGIDHKHAFKRVRGGPGGKLLPLMLHFAVNRPIGSTRGESDLTPIVPWAKRYSEWLKDRVRFNRRRTRQGLLDVEIADDGLIEAKREQLATSNPLEHGIYVHGKGERVILHSLSIGAGDVKDDGRVLRLAVATGANIGLHYLGEGGDTNYATAKEMGEPTSRFYTNRQTAIRGFLVDLVTVAYKRKVALEYTEMPADGDLQITTSVTEVARADNAGLAAAARDIVEALNEMKAHGWIDDRTAIKWAFQFAGETIDEKEIGRILAGSNEEPKEEPAK
jgi:hypothetical protein